MPSRVQLSRRKGWRKPEGAIVVARPSKWGNPFKPVPFGRRWKVSGPTRECGWVSFGNRHDAIEHAVICYAVWARAKGPEWVAPLWGRDLCCWCRIGEPCHADVLLEIANA